MWTVKSSSKKKKQVKTANRDRTTPSDLTEKTHMGRCAPASRWITMWCSVDSLLGRPLRATETKHRQDDMIAHQPATTGETESCQARATVQKPNNDFESGQLVSADKRQTSAGAVLVTRFCPIPTPVGWLGQKSCLKLLFSPSSSI